VRTEHRVRLVVVALKEAINCGAFGAEKCGSFAADKSRACGSDR
jgi:hypothetical protein